MLIGNSIKQFLLGILEEDEVDKSSHWVEYLSDFSYDEEEGARGFLGFGIHDEAGSRIKALLHWIMLIPFKLRAEGYIDVWQVAKKAKHITRAQNRIFNMDILRQVLTVSFCKRRIPNFTGNGVAVVIGDGFGTLSSLLFLTTNQKVISVNLNQVLLVDYLYTRKIIPDETTALVETESSLAQAMSSDDVRFILIRAVNHHLLRNVRVYTAFNVCSMQEMNPPVIAGGMTP